jgi:beta-lactamase class A
VRAVAPAARDALNFRMPLLRHLVALLILLVSTSNAQPPIAPQTAGSPSPAQVLVNRAIESALEQFQSIKLNPDELAVTLIDLRASDRAARASYRGDLPIYPASVIKLFYLAAAHRWMEDGQLADTPELRRALRDMIVDSSNDATHYVIDLLTDTTSGPELSDADIKIWFEKRNAVTRYFAGLDYTAINVNKKPWGDGPYGRESQAIRMFEQKRNMLTTDAAARLLTEIATRNCISPARSAEMMTLLARNPAAKETDADSQARFTGPALPVGAKLWSKAGWTSVTRHDAAYVELPNGAKFVLVVFTTNHAKQKEIIPAVARVIVDGMMNAGSK